MAAKITTTKLGENDIPLAGDGVVAVGADAPAVTAVGVDLSPVSLDDDAFKGKPVILNIFPSVDTEVCAASVRKFNAVTSEAAPVLCLSYDLPFALKRFCGAEGLDKVHNASLFRDGRDGAADLAGALGLRMAAGPLAGLTARAVVVVDKDRKVSHVEVPPIGQEPDYDAATKAVSA